MANKANNKLYERWGKLAGITEPEKTNLNESISVEKTDVFKVVSAKNGVTYGIVKEGYKFHIKIAKDKNKFNLSEDFRAISGSQHKDVNSFYSIAEADKALNMRLLAINEDWSQNEEFQDNNQAPAPQQEPSQEPAPEVSTEVSTEPIQGDEEQSSDDVKMDMDDLDTDEDGDGELLSLLGKLTGEIRNTPDLTVPQIKNILNSVISATPVRELEDDERRELAKRILKGGKKSVDEETDLNESVSDEEVNMIKMLGDQLIKDKAKMTRDDLVKSLENVIAKVKSVKSTLGEEDEDLSDDASDDETVDLLDDDDLDLGDDTEGEESEPEEDTLDSGDLEADDDTLEDLDGDGDGELFSSDDSEVSSEPIELTDTANGLDLVINLKDKEATLSGSEDKITKLIQQLVAEEKGLKPRKLSESKNEKVQKLRKMVKEALDLDECDIQSKEIEKSLKESSKGLDKAGDALYEMIKKRLKSHKAGKKLNHGGNKLFKAIDETIETCYSEKK